MKEILDIAIPLAFVAFMVFIFGGYHSTKSKEREEERKKKENSEE